MLLGVSALSFFYMDKKPIENLFYQLIRVALGTQGILSRTPSAAVWGELYAMAKKQSLVGICFAGVQRLQMQQQCPQEQLYLQWIGMAAKIQQRNEIVNRRCQELQLRLADAGFRSSILKGQGMGALYSSSSLSLLRQSGDIDVWVDGGIEKAMEYARSVAHQQIRFDYKNLHLPIFLDTEVEMHYRVDVIMNLLKHKKMQEFWKEHGEQVWGGRADLNSSGESLTITCPTIELNAFYILFHCYRHIFEGGVGLRQVMDYYFVLQRLNERVDADELKSQVRGWIEDFGLMRFARAMMWILQNVFGMSRECLLCEPDPDEGRVILNDIMCTGNFGHHDDRVWNIGNSARLQHLMHMLQHGWHLFRNYPREVISSPIWLAWHWCWKRCWLYIK